MVVGIDNGATGWMTAINSSGRIDWHEPVPMHEVSGYNKDHAPMTRLNWPVFRDRVREIHYKYPAAKYLIEKPFTGRNANNIAIGMRVFEAMLIILEQETSTMPEFIFSGDWQKHFGIKRGQGTKVQAKAMAKKIWKEKFKDADSALMARWWWETHDKR